MALAISPIPNIQSIAEPEIYVYQVYVPYFPEQLTSNVLCNCIAYAKLLLGRTGESWGNAKDIVPNSTEPKVGSLVLTREGPYGHAGVVINYTATTVTFEEANYFACQKSVRTLDRADIKIRGYKLFH